MDPSLDREVKLEDMLLARDRRRDLQLSLLAQYGKPLICFTMNIPGPRKNSSLIRSAYFWGKRMLEEALREQGMEVIEKNAERISEQLMLFDDDAYVKLSKSIASGAYKKDGVSDSIQEERLMSERKRLKGMEAIMDSNEEILLLLDKCAGEVAGLSNGEDEARNEQILDEIRKLIETTKYYQSKS